MRTLKTHIPEIYFFFAILYYWSLTATIFNWFAIGLLVLLGILIFTKNQVFGILFSVLFIIINLYMLLALFSEFSEFGTFNTEAKTLLGIGLLFLGLNLLFSALMLYKYASKTKKSALNLTNKTTT